MASVKIENLVEKYFQAETSIAEENELRNYFSSQNVVAHLEQYKPLFGYLSLAAAPQFKREFLPQSKKNTVMWVSIAASVVVLLGIGTCATKGSDLGTYDDPEKAFRATQKALSLLSANVNVGIESVMYVQEYKITKEKIFIETQKQTGSGS
ncbi:MAG TPA: hypothetical protein PLV47_09125 [Flavobacterium sp.]|nr:hypothetical protein [Flavobacterium sp.]